MIRARSRTHLENLQKRFPLLAHAEIVTLPNRDYRYRLLAPKEVWATTIAELAREQERSNFKDEAGRFQGSKGSDYAHALHRVWSLMLGLQDRR